MSAAVQAAPDEVAFNPSPRPSGPRLVRRLLTKPGLAARLADLEVVPYGGRQVLGAVAKLVAIEGDGAFYAVHPTLSPGGLARKVVSMQRHINSTVAEALTNDILAALAAAELIELEPNGVRLPLPPPQPDGDGHSSSVVEFTVGGKPPPVRLGARRKGESWEDYHARHAAAKAQRDREVRAAAGGQRSLALPPTLVGSTSNKLATYGSRTSDSHENKSGFIEEVEVGTSTSPTYRPHAEEDDDLEISTSESSSSFTEVRAHASDLSGNKSADLSGQEVSKSDISDLSRDALTFGDQISRVLELAPDQAAQAPRAVQNWLGRWPRASALIPEALERCRAANEGKRVDGQKPIRTIGYVRQTLQALLATDPGTSELAAGRATGPAAAAPASPWAPDPRVLEVASWAQAPASVQRDIARVLDAMAEPNPGERMRRLSSCHMLRQEAFVLVATRHPTLYENAGKEPPPDPDVRAAQRPTVPA